MSIPQTRSTSLILSSIITLATCFCSCSQSLTPQHGQVYAEEPNRQFWTADWSPDGKFIAVAGVDSILYIFHAYNLKLYKSFLINDWMHSVAWHPRDQKLAIATLEKYVLLLDLDTESISHLQQSGGSRAIGWNASGEMLAVGDLDGVIKLWNKDGRLMRTIGGSYTDETVGRSYLSLDWHPRDDVFVATNFQIHLFDPSGVAIREMQHRNPEAIMLCAAWHPSGEFFVIGDYGHNWEGENVPSLLHFWSPEGKLIRQVPGSKQEYRNIAWDPAGESLATASDVLRIWTKEGVLVAESKSDSTNHLWGIDWSPDGRRIVTASRYKTVALWDRKARLIKRIDIED